MPRWSWPDPENTKCFFKEKRQKKVDIPTLTLFALLYDLQTAKQIAVLDGLNLVNFLESLRKSTPDALPSGALSSSLVSDPAQNWDTLQAETDAAIGEVFSDSENEEDDTSSSPVSASPSSSTFSPVVVDYDRVTQVALLSGARSSSLVVPPLRSSLAAPLSDDSFGGSRLTRNSGGIGVEASSSPRMPPAPPALPLPAAGAPPSPDDERHDGRPTTLGHPNKTRKSAPEAANANQKKKTRRGKGGTRNRTSPRQLLWLNKKGYLNRLITSGPLWSMTLQEIQQRPGSVQLDLVTTVGILKTFIQDRLGLPAHLQRILLPSTQVELEDSQMLQNYEVLLTSPIDIYFKSLF
jgi:hypothetical protein